MPHPTSFIASIWTTDTEGVCTSAVDHAQGALPPFAVATRLPDWLRAYAVDGQAADRVADALARHTAFGEEVGIKCADGVMRRVAVSGLPGMDTAGRCTGWSGAFADVTEQKATLDRALRSDAEHRLIVDHSMDLIAHCGVDGRYIHVSPSYTTLLGWEAADIVGRNGLDFLHPDDRAQAAAALARVVAGEEIGDVIEVRKRHRDGHYVELGSKLRKVADPATGAVFGAVLVSRDITREKEMLHRVEQAHARVRTILESIEDGFFSVNRDWEITYANTLAEVFAGVEPGTSGGKVLWDLANGLEGTETSRVYRRAMERRENEAFETFYEPEGVWLSVRVYAHEDGLSVFFHDISDRKRAEERLEQLATRDDLTGLPNRAWLNGHLRSMLGQARGQAETTVLFIDLNRFKEVNDSLGHAAGDHLLRQVGLRLQSCLRPGDVVARLGGDEFVVAAHCAGREAAAGIAQRLLKTLTNPFHIDGLEMCVGASIGISLSGQDGATPELLFQNADTAMYKAKALGASSYQFFEPEMSVEARRRLQVETALRRALELGQFELHYQPRIDVRTFRLRGVEVLLRWKHPELGQVAPFEFVPIAEERGHIEEIGRWVLREACRVGKELSDKYGTQLHVSVNVSARQLRSAELVADVEQALRVSGFAPRALELELTESALIDDIEQSVDVLHRLKRLGVKLALDDFGTGYSSLSYLKRFPVDVLKLDRSFFLDECPNGDDFVAALVHMAHALGLTVVAEGIETEEVMETLRDCRCDEAQGYLFARPMALPDFDKFLQCEVPGALAA
ncbi:EAL domain-containing protein [Telluria mixta]|uniref:EAL domain-containing protein n=1 Tax=Telluria mixta TaxID=34071 RepID=A0ABT2C707_9BURK|nr:EAL domain-containing protein [Telluria mixta]MCS0633193.1 EAL domain-containing protein [Telluria mixta]WEM94678.1 EAL domain-containing protein [Telluria mixta]